MADMEETLVAELMMTLHELAPGQIQYMNNFRLAHCRTEYEDPKDAAEKRHLVRIFLRDAGRRLLATRRVDRLIEL